MGGIENRIISGWGFFSDMYKAGDGTGLSSGTISVHHDLAAAFGRLVGMTDVGKCR
jgi:hypothetical protein